MLLPSPPDYWHPSVTESWTLPPDFEGSIMPVDYSPSSTSIKRPRCSHCTSRMMLARISPGPVGFEHRWFECPRCNSIQDEVVATDPMNPASEGWLAGELRLRTEVTRS